jgi:hypothetical protein
MSLMTRMFGPSRREIWKQLSEQIGANYVDGGFWRGDKVEVQHGEWILTLDSYAVSTGKVTIVYTRMRAPYVNPSGFRFTVYRRSIFTNIGKFFGMQASRSVRRRSTMISSSRRTRNRWCASCSDMRRCAS